MCKSRGECDGSVNNQFNEIGFTYRKDKRKLALTPKQKKTRLYWGKAIMECV